jgi:hypothetical protein
MSFGPLAVVLLVPLVVVACLRTYRWKQVIAGGAIAGAIALIYPAAAVLIVISALVALVAGAVLLGTGAHAVRKPNGTLSVAELVVGGLALRLWRRRQARRWSDSWARRWVDVPRSR